LDGRLPRLVTLQMAVHGARFECTVLHSIRSGTSSQCSCRSSCSSRDRPRWRWRDVLQRSADAVVCR